MADETKIHLSSIEMELVTNPGWILTKNEIIKKVQELLASVQRQTSKEIYLHPAIFDASLLAIPPKISKGENYLGLPWLILDQPRCFDKKNIFAIRTMFWWGHFFSLTLQLAGSYYEKHRTSLAESYDKLVAGDFFYGVNDDPWQHHFEADNYKPVGKFSAMEFSTLLRQRSFIKLAAKISLKEWENAVSLLTGKFSELVNCFQSGETGP